MVPQSLSPQQQLGMVAVPNMAPQQQPQIVPQGPQQFRRGPTYRMPQQPGQPFGQFLSFSIFQQNVLI